MLTFSNDIGFDIRSPPTTSLCDNYCCELRGFTHCVLRDCKGNFFTFSLIIGRRRFLSCVQDDDEDVGDSRTSISDAEGTAHEQLLRAHLQAQQERRNTRHVWRSLRRSASQRRGGSARLTPYAPLLTPRERQLLLSADWRRHNRCAPRARIDIIVFAVSTTESWGDATFIRCFLPFFCLL